MLTALGSVMRDPGFAGGAPLVKVRPSAMDSPVSGLRMRSGSANQAAPLCHPDRLLRSRGRPIAMPSAMMTSMAMVEAVTSQA